MKLALILLALATVQSAQANFSGSAEARDGRIRIQYRMMKDEKQGAFVLRNILEKHGYKKDAGGYVRTGNDLFPLEVETYLYDDGNYVFTLYLPVESDFYALYNQPGFVAFQGEAAKQLFQLVKQHLPKQNTDLVELYQWGENGNSACNHGKDGYMCTIQF